MEYLNATIDQILNFILRLSGDSSLVIYLLIFGAVFLVVIGIAVIAGGRSPVERRMAGQAVGTVDASELESLRRKEREGPWVQLLGSLEKHFASSNEKKRTTLQQRMKFRPSQFSMCIFAPGASSCSLTGFSSPIFGNAVRRWFAFPNWSLGTRG